MSETETVTDEMIIDANIPHHDNQDTMMLRDFTVEVVTRFMGRNDMTIEQIPSLISTVYESLVNLGQKSEVTTIDIPAEPAVAINESVFPDYIVCLEDGKRLKMLKRHLATSYKLTPEQYRAKWGLEANYPMVAPNYADVRSELAKKAGLGLNRSASGRKTTSARKITVAKATTKRKVAGKK